MPKPKQSGWDVALGMLARRGYAAKEMAGALLKKDFSQAEVAAIMARLVKNNFLDDAAFALSRARYRATVSGWGKVRIIQELMQKGVEEAVAKAAVADLAEPEDTFSESHDFQDAANTILARRFKSLDEMFPAVAAHELEGEARREHYTQLQKEVHKRVSFLVRRGFSLEEAKRALAHVEIEAD